MHHSMPLASFPRATLGISDSLEHFIDSQPHPKPQFLPVGFSPVPLRHTVHLPPSVAPRWLGVPQSKCSSCLAPLFSCMEPDPNNMTPRTSNPSSPQTTPLSPENSQPPRNAVGSSPRNRRCRQSLVRNSANIMIGRFHRNTRLGTGRQHHQKPPPTGSIPTSATETQTPQSSWFTIGWVLHSRHLQRVLR